MTDATLSLDSFKTKSTLKVGTKSYVYYSLPKAEKAGLKNISKLPYSMKVLLENLLRNEDNRAVRKKDIEAIDKWARKRISDAEIGFKPARVLMQDFTGVPAVVDLAAMRDAMANLGGDPTKINPLVPVDLVIDHSVMIDEFGSKFAFKKNVALEYERNGERYSFLRWGQSAFNNFSVVPPGTGICHQVNLEYLAQTVWTKTVQTKRGPIEIAYPDTLVGTDSHTTMVNGLAVLGWGVGGIEAEAAMLGQALSMVIPQVVGFRLHGKLREGVTATDLVLTVTQMLRRKGVVNKFVEFYGAGLDALPLEDRATIANMAPEYGATCGFFPIDAETIRFLKATGRSKDRVALVEAYAKAQGMFRTTDSADPVFTDTLELDLDTVEPSLAGPKRPQDRVALGNIADNFLTTLTDEYGKGSEVDKKVQVPGTEAEIGHGAAVIAAITSCTNTSNPYVMIGAGLLARNARARGLKRKPWVKTSLAPGSQVVTDYLLAADLQKPLDELGFNLTGYGCTTCIGNSGPLPDDVTAAVTEGDLAVAAVLSGNRNFEGRVNPLTRANYLASPPLVVAYALAGSVTVNLETDPLGEDKAGNPVYLRDIWPTAKEVSQTVRKAVTSKMFKERYANVFEGDAYWKKVKFAGGQTYKWDMGSTYVQNPPYFEGMEIEPKPVSEIQKARILALFGDSITTDHISPAGSIKASGPAGVYLQEHQVPQRDFNSYGARRGNHEVMMRGTFANIRIKNAMLGGKEGGNTLYQPDGTEMSIYDAAMKYQAAGVPLIVFAGKEYGTGSSRDWAAKGTLLLGVKAVVAESFERIHRSNLVGMGILPLQFLDGMTWKDLNLKGDETIDIEGVTSLKQGMTMNLIITSADGTKREIAVKCRVDTVEEVDYYKNGGILPYVLRNLLKGATAETMPSGATAVAGRNANGDKNTRAKKTKAA